MCLPGVNQPISSQQQPFNVTAVLPILHKRRQGDQRPGELQLCSQGPLLGRGGGDEDPARGVPEARLLGLGAYNCNIYLVICFCICSKYWLFL